MIRNRLKNLLRPGILLFGIALFVWGCTDSEFEEVPLLTEETAVFPTNPCLPTFSYNNSVFHDQNTPVSVPGNSDDEWDWVEHGVPKAGNTSHRYKIRGFPGDGFDPGANSYRNIYWDNHLTLMGTEWRNRGNGREFHSKVKRVFNDNNGNYIYPITSNNASVQFTAQFCGFNANVAGEPNESQIFIESFSTIDNSANPSYPNGKNELNVWLFKRDVSPAQAKDALVANGYTLHSQTSDYFYLWYWHPTKEVFKMRVIVRNWNKNLSSGTISGTYDIDAFWKYFKDNPRNIDPEYQLTGGELFQDIGFGVNAKRPSIGQALFTNFHIKINGN